MIIQVSHLHPSDFNLHPLHLANELSLSCILNLLVEVWRLAVKIIVRFSFTTFYRYKINSVNQSILSKYTPFHYD